SAQIRVRDGGRGIDPVFLPHIFERFQQADASSTRSEGGLGLGLAIVRHIVELHGGTVEAASQGEGKGATFTVRLPLPALSSAAGGSYETVRDGVVSEAPSLAGVRVLIVDDEEDGRNAITPALERGGGGVGHRAAGVGDALAVLSRETVDVVVSDLGMPDEDGFALIGELRAARRGDAAKIPVLALTAYAGAREESRVLTAGFDGYLAKPIDAAALTAAVSRLRARR